MADDAEQNALIREVDEDLRQERLERLWKEYGKFVIAACVIVVAGVGGNQAWKSWQAKQLDRDSTTFQSALETLTAGQPKEAEQILENFSGDAAAGYKDLGRLTAAAALAQSGDKKSAIASYDSLAKDDATDPTIAKLAGLYAALAAVGVEDHAAVVARLQPYSDDKSWRYIAAEIEALSAQAGGDDTAAVEAYKRIADASDAPAGIRRRATQMISALGG